MKGRTRALEAPTDNHTGMFLFSARDRKISLIFFVPFNYYYKQSSHHIFGKPHITSLDLESLLSLLLLAA